ncbi:MAG: diguanylate cyclase [Firmicutes bacterium]|nr:diguanylate cyclase [Bacillota bacterium]
MELLLILLANSIAPVTLFAESRGDAVHVTPTSISVPLSYLIALDIALIVAIALYVTARRSKRIAERIASGLYESELYYGRLLESLACGVFTASLDRIFIYANPAFCELFNSRLSEIIGKQLDEVFGENVFREIVAALECSAVPAKDWSHVLSITTASSGHETKHLEVDLGFILMNDAPLAIRGIVRDISESKRLEEELLAQTAITAEKARLCKILKTKNELLEEHQRRLREVNIGLDKKLDETRRLHKIAEQMAITDSVTELYNYRHFQERFAEELEVAQQHGNNLSVLMIDIDGFKDYNDAFGHMAGDDALRAVSKILTASVRSSDLVARYGGEEFVILLFGADKGPANKVAENIRARIAGHSFPGKAGQSQNGLTVSIGVATYPMDGKTRKDLLYAADMACYRVKREGKNRVVQA